MTEKKGGESRATMWGHARTLGFMAFLIWMAWRTWTPDTALRFVFYAFIVWMAWWMWAGDVERRVRGLFVDYLEESARKRKEVMEELERLAEKQGRSVSGMSGFHN